MSPSRIHHINFVVQDLGEAILRYERLLGVDRFEIVDHAARGAHVARTRVGECWLVLVCPYDPESAPGRFLAENGEGFFLMSLAVDDLQRHLDELQEQGSASIDSAPRKGILNWQVADIGKVHGALLQLTQSAPEDRASERPNMTHKGAPEERTSDDPDITHKSAPEERTGDGPDMTHR